MNLFSWRSVINKPKPDSDPISQPDDIVEEPKKVGLLRSKISKTVRSFFSSIRLKSEESVTLSTDFIEPSLESNLELSADTNTQSSVEPIVTSNLETFLVGNVSLEEDLTEISDEDIELIEDSLLIEPQTQTRSTFNESSIYPDIRTPIPQHLLDEYYSDPAFDEIKESQELDSSVDSIEEESFDNSKMNDGDFSANPFASFFESNGYLEFDESEILKYNQLLMDGILTGELKFLTFQNELDDVVVDPKNYEDFNSALLNNKPIPSREFAKYLLDLNKDTTLKVDESSIEKFSLYILKKQALSSKLFAKFIFDLKKLDRFTEQEVLEFNNLLKLGILNSNISDELLRRKAEYFAFVKVNDLFSLSQEEDDEYHDYILTLDQEVRSEVEISESLIEKIKIRASLSSNIGSLLNEKRSLVETDQLTQGEIETDQLTQGEIESLDDQGSLEEIETSNLNSDSDSNNLVDEVLERISGATFSDSYLEDNISNIGSSLKLDAFLNLEQFDEIFSNPIEEIITSQDRAIDLSSESSIFDFKIWSNPGEDQSIDGSKPNQDCTISFDNGLVLCDGAGSYENSEFVSAYFANFFYTHRKIIQRAILLIHDSKDTTSNLNTFFVNLLSFASSQLKQKHSDLFVNGQTPSTTLSLVLKVKPDNIEDNKFLTLTLGDSPIYFGDECVSGDRTFYDSYYGNDFEFMKVCTDNNFISDQFIESLDISFLSDLKTFNTFRDSNSDEFNRILNRFKYETRNIILSGLPSDDIGLNRFISRKTLSVQFVDCNFEKDIIVCSDGLSDNFSSEGIFEISQTPVDQLMDINLPEKAEEMPSFFMGMYKKFKNDDSTFVKMNLKQNLKSLLESDFEVAPFIEFSEVLLNSSNLIPEFNADSSETEAISEDYKLELKKESWFKRKFSSARKSMKDAFAKYSRNTTSFFTNLKSKFYSFDFLGSFNKFSRVMLLSKFSIAIYALLMTSFNDSGVGEVVESVDLIQQTLDFVRGSMQSYGLTDLFDVFDRKIASLNLPIQESSESLPLDELTFEDIKINDDSKEFLSQSSDFDQDETQVFDDDNNLDVDILMSPDSKYFTNVICDANESTLSENSVDSLNPDNPRINTNISYSVNLNNSDSHLLQRDINGQVIGKMTQGQTFKFTGVYDTVVVNNNSEQVLYAEAKTSNGNTFWIARAYARPNA